jgi:hypothetical protein
LLLIYHLYCNVNFVSSYHFFELYVFAKVSWNARCWYKAYLVQAPYLRDTLNLQLSIHILIGRKFWKRIICVFCCVTIQVLLNNGSLVIKSLTIMPPMFENIITSNIYIGVNQYEYYSYAKHFSYVSSLHFVTGLYRKVSRLTIRIILFLCWAHWLRWFDYIDQNMLPVFS